MKSRTINSTLQELIKSNSGLSSYLQALSRGRQATPRSWLYEKMDANAVLQAWIPKMKSANNKTRFGNIFNQFDLKQVEKFGPQGAVPPVASAEAIEVVEPLFSSSDFNDEEKLAPYFKEAQKFAREAFGSDFLTKRPKSFERVVDNMRERDTLVTNSGFPRFARRSMVKDLEVHDAMTGKAYDYPAIILFRQYNGKLRPVWMFPMSLNLIEFSFSQVIQDVLTKSSNYFVGTYITPWLGYEFVKRNMTFQWYHKNVVGGDTTAMDAHMRPAQIRLVYEIVKWLFQKDYWADLYKSLMTICSIPLLYSTTEEYVGTHGLASGSGWTQLTETILQMFMAWRVGAKGQGIGDDFFWVVDWTADEIVDYLGNFGLPANPAKQSVSSTELTFLQRLNVQGFFSRECDEILGGYYPTIRALNSMLNPEKFHKPKDWNSDKFCIRNYMILENCVDNPCFEQFVKFVVRGQKDMIPFAKMSRSELDRVQKEAIRVPGLFPTYNQEKRDKPLWQFDSIDIASEL